MHLLWEKLLDQDTLLAWSGRHSCCKKALEPLVGKQSHASRIVQPGKTILSYLYSATDNINHFES